MAAWVDRSDYYGEGVLVIADRGDVQMDPRPLTGPDVSEEMRADFSPIMERAVTESESTDVLYAEGGHAERFAADSDRDREVLQDGLGAMRGFILLVGLYVAMGAIGLTGWMLWRWLG